MKKYNFISHPSSIQKKQQAKHGLRLALLHNRFLPQVRPTPSKRFQLLKRFSFVSLSAFVTATGLLAGFYRYQAVQSLVLSAEDNNVALTQVFANTLWPEYGPFLSSAQSLSNEELATDPAIAALMEDVVAQFDGLRVAKVKVFNLQGRTVFSTDASQIGADESRSSGFQSAKSGTVMSQLGHRDTFKALQTTLEDRHLFSSYVPIRADGSHGEIVGVFELYSDVTPLLQHIDQTQGKIILGSLLILSVLYSILLLFVRRADHLLKSQYRLLQESEGRYRQQASELEYALAELRQTQSQMLQSEKMSSLGQLVAGVAHEINNPISFIHGNVAHAQRYIQGLLKLIETYENHCANPSPEIQAEAEAIDLDFIRDDLPKTLASMRIGSDRIREIVLSLRTFARLDEAEIKPVNIHNGLDSALIILNHRLSTSSVRPEIRVIKNYAVLPKIECYAGLLNQVFMNILSNAIDAIEEKSSEQTSQESEDYFGQITLKTCLPEDGLIEITIADNGSGIPQEIQRRIFDPFFTTKPVGKGTGMGMSISYKIITEKHKGKLTCGSTPGKGTEVKIQIPVRQTADWSTITNAALTA
jgi:signal transduction histidine kinase